MKWLVKVLIQNLVALMPFRVGEPLYFWMQRNLGRLRNLDPFDRFEGGVEMARRVRAHGGDLSGQRVLEIGTGWRLNSPLALWLMGAEVVTVDLFPLLKPQLVLEDISVLLREKARVQALLEPYGFREERWEMLERVGASGSLDPQLTGLPGLRYLAPQDAAQMSEYPDASFYGVFSFNVLEHIPKADLQGIFREALRLAHPDGLSVQLVDHSDHFAAVESNLSSVHFLRYTPTLWRLLGGNRLAFCNRLRSSEVGDIFRHCGFDLLEVEPNVDYAALEGIRSGREPLWGHFARMDPEDVATANTWYVMRTGVSNGNRLART